jgi:hypothetical protein
VTADWKRLVDHVMSVPTGVYEGYGSGGYDNNTRFGVQFGENRVSWCVIFDWCMYDDCNLQAIVPKVDNVGTFTNWAKARGQWSAYPSVGAWVNFENGGHTEVVVGFDKNYVYTKGGNTIATGAADSGQGNGVYLHDNPGTLRTSSKVVGYFAPRFPDGVCPPTADPHDPRGGTAVDSWKWTAADSTGTPTTPPTIPVPGDTRPIVYVGQLGHAASWDPPAEQGHKSYCWQQVLIVEQALNREGLLNSSLVDGSWGTSTLTAYAAWQRRCGYSGAAADGRPGFDSLTRLGNKYGFRVGN